MPNLDIYLIIPSAGLLMPLAGIGRSFRRDFAQHSLSVASADVVVAPRRTGLSMRWRKDSKGALIMEWTA
jgi:hypothetical protein